jgi:hypothetical protein
MRAKRSEERPGCPSAFVLFVVLRRNKQKKRGGDWRDAPQKPEKYPLPPLTGVQARHPSVEAHTLPRRDGVPSFSPSPFAWPRVRHQLADAFLAASSSSAQCTRRCGARHHYTGDALTPCRPSASARHAQACSSLRRPTHVLRVPRRLPRVPFLYPCFSRFASVRPLGMPSRCLLGILETFLFWPSLSTRAAALQP